ncbi:MAG: AAA family ATPase [Roseibium album]|uniref:AAA family ATPase n=1 Tax=Roseibium album TaxID=311410 RepID=UPI0032ECD1DA
MSTIEKAAARLAARQKSATADGAKARDGVAAEPPVAGPRHDVHAAGPLPIMAERFCEIDLDAIRERGFLTPAEGRSRLAGEMRRIKRPLLMNIQKSRAKGDGGPPGNLIMITSALPGEGKTFTSINLAMSIAAEVDRRVLLVDADAIKGDVARQLGLEPQRGLTDLLAESSHLSEDAVLTSNVDRLSVLPAGQSSDHVDELYASDMMVELTRALAEADPDRVVIFDASPLLATTEAAVLARRMGQTVLVVEAGKTPQDAVTQALTMLEGCANVSLVLNKTTGRASGEYTYGYSYGYGDKEDSRTESAQRG